MKYLSVQREKSRKYSQRWQQQHATDELKTIAAAVNYISEHGISNLDELDVALSSVSEKAYSIREGMKTAEQRMKELQKLIEYGRNSVSYTHLDVYKRQMDTFASTPRGLTGNCWTKSWICWWKPYAAPERPSALPEMIIRRIW